MTFFRTLPLPADGHADVPLDVMREMHRVRSAMMGIDQNNVQALGVQRSDIVQLTTTGDDAHFGIADALATGGSADPFAYDETSTNQTITREASDGAWVRHTAIELEITNRMDSYWLVGFSVQYELDNSGATHTDYVHAIARAVVSGSVGAGRPMAPLMGTGAATPANLASVGAVVPFFVAAGKHKILLETRVLWVGANDDDVVIDQSNVWAVGLYR